MKITQLPNGGEMWERVPYDAELVWRLTQNLGTALEAWAPDFWQLLRIVEVEHERAEAAMSHDECLKPKYKVGERVTRSGTNEHVIREVIVAYRVTRGGINSIWPEDTVLPLPAHVHQFTCECGEKCDE